MHTNSIKNVEIVPSGRKVGAEVRGLDLTQKIPSDIVDLLKEAWGKHLVLLYRDQSLEDDDIIRFATYFGGHPEAVHGNNVEVGRKMPAKAAPLICGLLCLKSRR